MSIFNLYFMTSGDRADGPAFWGGLQPCQVFPHGADFEGLFRHMSLGLAALVA
jgi:hypothetical protein